MQNANWVFYVGNIFFCPMLPNVFAYVHFFANSDFFIFYFLFFANIYNAYFRWFELPQRVGGWPFLQICALDQSQFKNQTKKNIVVINIMQTEMYSTLIFLFIICIIVYKNHANTYFFCDFLIRKIKSFVPFLDLFLVNVSKRFLESDFYDLK